MQLCVWKILKRHQAAVRFPWRIRHLIHSIPQSLLRAGQDLKPGFLDFVSTIRRGKIMYTHHAGRVYTCRSHAHVHARTHTACMYTCTLMYIHAHSTCSVKRLWHSWPSLFCFLFGGSRSHLRNLRDFEHPPPSLRSISCLPEAQTALEKTRSKTVTAYP